MPESPPSPCDPNLISYGEVCYSVLRVRPGEVLSEDTDAFGRGLREYPYDERGIEKQVLCPCWRRTTYGTVRCEYLDVECVGEDTPGPRALAEAHFGGPEAVALRTRHSWELPDELKICGVRSGGLQDVAVDSPDELSQLRPLFLEEMAGWLVRASLDPHWAANEAVRAAVAFFRERFGLAEPSYERTLQAIDALRSSP